MIDTLQSYSRHLMITQGPNPPIYNSYGPSSQSAGMMRYNTTSFQVEIYDGNAWLKAGGPTGIGLTPDAENALDWAKQKMVDEKQLKEKMEKYPALKDAYEQFKIIEALVNADEKLKDV